MNPDERGKERTMPVLIPKPTRIESAGNKPKLFDEYGRRVNSKHEYARIVHSRSLFVICVHPCSSVAILTGLATDEPG